MKLLFDQNLSYKLVQALKAEYPDSVHVAQLGYETLADREIWQIAKERRYTIVSKDSDFRDLGLVYGAPPKVILLNLGNCTTRDAIILLSSQKVLIETFALSSKDTTLVFSNS